MINDHRAGIGQVLTLVLIGGSAWLVVRIATAVVDSLYARYAANTPIRHGCGGSAPR